MDPKTRVDRLVKLGLLNPRECAECEWTARTILEGLALRLVHVHPHAGTYLEGRDITHETECETCDGWGTVNVPCHHAPDCCEVSQDCDDCGGAGIKQDKACDCHICCDVAELVEDEREDERKRLQAIVDREAGRETA